MRLFRDQKVRFRMQSGFPEFLKFLNKDIRVYNYTVPYNISGSGMKNT